MLSKIRGEGAQYWWLAAAMSHVFLASDSKIK